MERSLHWFVEPCVGLSTLQASVHLVRSFQPYEEILCFFIDDEAEVQWD